MIWFRNDLRLHDNVTLINALQSGDLVIPVYIFDPHHYRKSGFGFDKVGPFRAKFITRCVEDLRESLRGLGAELFVRVGHTQQVLAEMCAQYNVSAIYYSKEVAPDEVKEEIAVQDAVAHLGVKVHCFENSMLLKRDALPFSVAGMPDMFTSFRWQVEQQNIYGTPLEKPSAIEVCKDIEPGIIPETTDKWLDGADRDPRAALIFQGGESAALRRLEHYVWDINGPATYFETRNQLTGADYSTKLSPWLAVGAISPRYIFREIKRYEQQRISNKSTYWIGFELLWRDFFRLNMEKYHAELFFVRGHQRKNIAYKDDLETFARWTEGKTNNDFVNANMHELNNTGYMSNRGRQVVASYLVHDLGINWLIGAAYFERMLVDYDVSSNYGNWAYIAGVGNDPRENRYFNVDKQAATYDAEGTYRKLWASNS
jgi:deoxyribodipyrimidine photo-lyase